MPKKISRKKAQPGNQDKATVTRIVDEIVSVSSPLPDTTHLFSKIRELENTTTDYTAILSKKFSKSTIDEQLFMINHLFPHLKRLSLSESLTSVLNKETFAPRILVDILHYLIRSDTIVDTQLLESATSAGEIANQLSSCLEENARLESSESEKLITSFSELPDSLQLGIVMELLHFKGKQILPFLLIIFSAKTRVASKVIDFLGSRADETAVFLLNELLEGIGDKELSKSIKKTLYRLKNKGIDVSLPKDTKTSPAKKKEISLPPPTAYVTTMDPLGERLILAIKPKSEQELNIFQFLVSDQKGINDLIASITTPKEFDNYLEKISRAKDITMVKIDLDYCHFLIKEASQKNHASGTKIPEHFFLWKKFFGSEEKPLDKAAICTLLDTDEIKSKEILLKKSEDLVDKYQFSYWLLEWKLLIDCYKELYEIENSMIVLTDNQKKSRTAEITKKTAQLFFDDTNRILFKRRLEEVAYILFKTDRKEDAQSAFAAALAFEPGGVPSSDHPFALKTVEKNFAFLKEQSQKEKRSDTGRIILP
jgi:hypothetical protein